jgi:hypothetical protein
VAISAFLLSALSTAIGEHLQPIDALGKVPNPIHVPAIEKLIAPLVNFSWLFGTVGMVLGAASLLVRYRRSHGVERQQLKWIALSGLIAALGGLAILINLFVRIPLIENTLVAPALIVVGLGSLPLTSTIAILRYRLYDIDRIISRTVSYALITAVLGAVFVVVAVAPVTFFGSADSPDWVVAIATLMIVAMFRPVRRRVQNAVDRHFNRARYNAAHTIEAFNAHLREQVDIDELGVELRDVVSRTMQPTSVSLWLKSQP